MLVGLGDGGRGGKGRGKGSHRNCCGDGKPEPCDECGKGAKMPKGLKHLGGLGKKVRGARKVGKARGVTVTALGGLSGLGDNDLLDAGERATFLGLGDLGDTLDTSASYLTSDQIMRAADTFDVQLNSWLLDYAKAAAKLPPALVTQVDGYVARWRDVKNSFYIFETVRIKDMVNAMAEWNGLRDAVASYGVKSIVGPATVSVNGQQVAADKIPYVPDFWTQVATYAKWGGVLVGLGLAYKISSDMGLLKSLGGVFGKLTGGSAHTADG